MHILIWPKIEKQETVFYLLSAVAQKKERIREGYACESEKEERQTVEADREEPKASCLSFVTGTLLSESLKRVACSPFRFSFSNPLCLPTAIHAFYPQNL